MPLKPNNFTNTQSVLASSAIFLGHTQPSKEIPGAVSPHNAVSYDLSLKLSL